ncbi:MAG: HNH endonuclease, partial [Candidatus Eremiobacteraeota bacterium]|nr:HNH endonuclease [Candidatus Eremiobacteraeota bacterium]
MSDIFFGQSPALWSVETLVSHGHQVVTDLARDAATSTTTMRYLLGRCMLAMDRLGTYKEMGLSGSVHFATQHLKMNERLAKLVLKVTNQLEELPLLRQAALHGEIEWSQIREVASVATTETEEMWKELCLKNNCSQIQSLVSATPKGGIPGEIASKPPRKTSEYRCRFQPEMVVLIEQCLQKMSRKLGKPILFREAVERFFTEFLADKPYDEAAEKMLEEARKDFLAGRILQEPLVQKAREVAREVGILEDLGEADLAESNCPEVLQRVSIQLEGSEEPGKDHAAKGFAESLSATALSNAHALVALENLQKAVGGNLPWESLEESGPADKEPTHVGNSNAELRTESNIIEPDGSGPLDSIDCCKPQYPSQDSDSATPSKRPTSKVTPLRTPFSEQKTRGHLELEAPALLKDLMAHLKFNANSRFPTSAQRKALLRRDRYCCRTPGCTNHLFLEIHHIVRYSQGGKTLPRFLLTLCSRCHK